MVGELALEARIEEPHIEVQFTEKKRTWRDRWDGNLQITAEFYPDYPERTYEITYPEGQWEVTEMRSGNGIHEVLDLDHAIIDYLLSTFGTIRVEAVEVKKMMTVEQYSDFEKRTIAEVSSKMKRSQIFNLYEKRMHQKSEQLKESERRKATQAEEQRQHQESISHRQRQQETERRKAELSQKIKDDTCELEFKAFYPLTRAASQELNDYELLNTEVKLWVKNRFDKNKNLDDYPLMNPSNGTWSKFVRENLGQGFHNRLSNLEDELDNLFISVMEGVQSRIGEEGQVDEEMYKHVFCSTHKQVDVLELLEREKNTYVDLFNRLQGVLDQKSIDYRKVLNDMESRLQPQNISSFFSTLDNGPDFALAGFQITNEKEMFQTTLGIIIEDYTKFLVTNHNSLRYIFSKGGIPLNNGTEVIITQGQYRGSYGRVCYNNSNGTKDVTLLQGVDNNAANKKTTKTKIDYISPDYLDLAKEISNIQELGVKAKEFVQDAAKQSIQVTQDKQLDANQQKIKSWHLHLQEEIKFRNNLYQLMVTRIEEMYAEHEQISSPAFP